jgi:hypothetical protein
MAIMTAAILAKFRMKNLLKSGDYEIVACLVPGSASAPFRSLYHRVRANSPEAGLRNSAWRVPEAGLPAAGRKDGDKASWRAGKSVSFSIGS